MVEVNGKEYEKGIIKDFSKKSGMGLIVIEDEDGTLRHIQCMCPQTIRALDKAFPEFTQGTSFDADAIKGEEIYYLLDDLGVLKRFIPVSEMARANDAEETQKEIKSIMKGEENER